MSHDPGPIRLLRVLPVLFACAFLVPRPAAAHTPQDAIDSLQISPGYESDQTVFVLVQNYLLRSQNRGASWKQLVSGLDSPYVYTDIAISPGFVDDGTVFVATDGGGVYRSADRGESWARCSDGLANRNIGLLLAAGNGRLLAAGARNGMFLYGGDCSAWQRVLSDDVQVTALHVLQDGAGSRILGGDSDGGLWLSGPSGDDWQRVARLEGVGAITSLAYDGEGGAGGVLYVGTAGAGLLRSPDFGASVVPLSDDWPDRTDDCLGRRLSDPRPDRHVRDIEVVREPGGAHALYVTTWYSAVYVSGDAGESWDRQSSGITCDNQAGTYANEVPHYRDIEASGAEVGEFFVGGFDGLYRSSDMGRTWTQLETLPVHLIRGIDVSASLAGDYGIALGTYGGGAYVSLDQGRTWTIKNHGLVTTRLADLEFSPRYPEDSRLYGLSKEHLLVSPAPVAAWSADSMVYRGWRKRLGSGLERHLYVPPRFGTKLFLSESERRRVWPMQIELSPEFATDGTMLVGLRAHGVWKSTDAGASWHREWDGPTDFVTALQVSPGFATDGTAFAGIRDSGIYVTRDAGETWRAANTGFEFLANIEATVAPNYYIDPPLHTAIKDVLLVVSPDFSNDQAVFASSSEGLFRSSDAGRTWSELPLGDSAPDIPVIALGISPEFGDDGMILVSLKGHGLLRSTDGGTTFEGIGTDLLRQNHDLRFIEFSPHFADDGVIYGATDEVLLRSADRGLTWSVIERPIRYEDWRGEDRGPVLFSGKWAREAASGFSASTQAVSSQPGAAAVLNFTGTSITWIGARGPGGGTARITIDGTVVDEVSLRSATSETSVELFTIEDLSPGEHTISIEVMDRGPAGPAAGNVSIDAFDVRGF